MSMICFATWDGGGNVPPVLALAVELRRRGHTVRVLGHPTQHDAVTAAGLPFAGYRSARPFRSEVHSSPIGLVNVFGDRSMGADVVAALAEEPADLVVVDCLLFGVMDALVRAGRRYVVLEHLFDGYLRGPGVRSPIGVGLWLRGLRPTALLERAELCLVATLPELDPGRRRDDVVHTGPFVSGVPAASASPRVLLSLSTFAYGGMARAWQRALDAVAELPVEVVATAGPVIDPRTLRAGANTDLTAWAPHAEVMPDVSAVFGHGGHATTVLALAHGLPLVVMPVFGLGDQPMVAKAVQDAGAGLVVRRSDRPARMRAAVEQVLSAPAHRTAAQRLGERIRELDGVRAAADLVEQRVARTVS